MIYRTRAGLRLTEKEAGLEGRLWLNLQNLEFLN